MKLLILFTDGFDPEFISKYDLRISKLGHYQTYPCFYPNTQTQLACFVTGKREENYVQDTKKFSRSELTGPFWWDKIRQDIKLGIINIPFLYPPPVINGWAISGVDTPVGAVYTHPDNLWLDLDGMGYIIHPEINRRQQRYGWLPWDRGNVWTREVSQEKWQETFSKELEVFRWLMKNHPVDVAFLGISYTDTIDSLYRDTPKFETEYRRIDAILMQLIDELKPEKVIAFSDHGDYKGHRSPAYFTSNFPAEIKDITDIHRLIVEASNA